MPSVPSGPVAESLKTDDSPSALTVLKFGGAAVRNPACIARSAKHVAHQISLGKHVIAVISAMGSTTDDLLKLAHAVNPKPPLRELDMLISTGERVSCSLLAMALHAIGVGAESYTGSQTGIITTDDHSQARIVDVRPDRIRLALKRVPVAIIAGFQGVSLSKDITTLGRGGTDTTAVAMAVAFGCPTVTFYKEVDGIYTADPNEDPDSVKIPHLSHALMKEICANGSGVLHDRAVALAERNNIQLIVRSFRDPPDSVSCTVVGPQTSGAGSGPTPEAFTDDKVPSATGSTSSRARVPVYEA